MKKIDFKKCTLEQLEYFSVYGGTPAICTEAFKEYKNQGGGKWGYLAKYGRTLEICTESFEEYKKQGGEGVFFRMRGGSSDMLFYQK